MAVMAHKMKTQRHHEVRLQALCSTNRAWADASSGNGHTDHATHSTLLMGQTLFAAYQTPTGDIEVSIHDGHDNHGGQGWAKPENVTVDYSRREHETWTAPTLVHGPDNVVWLFYLSQERRMLFCHRHFGSRWGQRMDLQGIHHVVPFFDGHFSEERAPLAGFEVIRADHSLLLLLESSAEFWDPPLEHLESPDDFVGPNFDPRLAPGRNDGYPLRRSREIHAAYPRAQPGESVLFVDNLEVAQIQGLHWSPETAQKHSANPVIRAGQNIWEGRSLNLSGATALHDDGKYRLWYAAYEVVGQGQVPKYDKLPENWQKYNRVCYAESNDGIQWIKPPLGLVEYGGSRKNNIVPHLWRSPLIVKDQHEKDPKSYYKCVLQWEVDSFVPTYMRYSTSPDGLQWTSQPGERTYPGTRPWYFGWTSFFRDDTDPNPDRRWKAYGYLGTGPTRRGSGLAYSADCIHWQCEPVNPIIGRRQVRAPFIHDLVVWQESGLYLGLLQVSDAFHNEEYELVVSRDGIHFSMVMDTHKFLARGLPDQWDHGSLLGCTMPLRIGDQHYFYYGGQNNPSDGTGHETDRWNDPEAALVHCGLATVGVGRYAGFSPTSNSDPGALVTVPICPGKDQQTRLCINARVPQGGRIRVACLDADTQQPLNGCSLEAATPIQKSGACEPVTWKDAQLPTLPTKPFRLQLEVVGLETKIFGFSWRR